MSDVTDAEIEAIDLAVVAYRDDGVWNLVELPGEALETVGSIAAELRRYPGETGSLGLVSIDEDFVILVRVAGDVVRVLLSDATAGTDWPLARSVLDHLGVEVEGDDDQAPVGELGIVADLGFSADEMSDLLDDLDLYPEEVLGEIANHLGFGDEFGEYVDEVEGIDDEEDLDDEPEDRDDLDVLADLDGLDDFDEIDDDLELEAVDGAVGGAIDGAIGGAADVEAKA